MVQQMIAMMLATGLREGEIVSLNVDDLYQTYGNVSALRVKSGKGAEARMVPFGICCRRGRSWKSGWMGVKWARCLRR